MRWHFDADRKRMPHLCTFLWAIRALDWKREPRTKL